MVFQSLFDADWVNRYLPYLLVWAAVTIPGVLVGWLAVFPKAGLPRWAALVPGYNVYLLVVGVAKLSVLWFVLLWVPAVQVIAAILVNVEVAKRFGRSESFGLGLALVGFVFYPLIGFGDARYQE
jgi:phosphotransferase system  glucose/maltose/N-acetylglucosamine-specific IIC component